MRRSEIESLRKHHVAHRDLDTQRIALLTKEVARRDLAIRRLDDQLLVDDVKGMSWTAMGELLGCSPATAKNRVTKARRRVAADHQRKWTTQR